MAEALGMVHKAEGTTSRVMVASRPKVSFWPDGSTSLVNYGWLFVLYHMAKRSQCSISVEKEGYYLQINCEKIRHLHNFSKKKEILVL
jgi:hypothetical protein